MASPEQKRNEDSPQIMMTIPSGELSLVQASQKPAANPVDTASLARHSIEGSQTSQLLSMENSSSTANADNIIKRGEASPVETDGQAVNAHDPLVQDNDVSSLEEQQYVKWGIAWKTPIFMVLWALVGLSLVLGHHFYYQSLNGTRAGSSSRQNWALRFGTAFTFLVVACLKATCNIAYYQYIWTLFRRKQFSLDTLDKLFAVTSDPTAFLSRELLRHAKVAIFVAAVCW
jgi:hypothetical protein